MNDVKDIKTKISRLELALKQQQSPFLSDRNCGKLKHSIRELNNQLNKLFEG
jgi:hypothetical protein